MLQYNKNVLVVLRHSHTLQTAKTASRSSIHIYLVPLHIRTKSLPHNHNLLVTATRTTINKWSKEAWIGGLVLGGRGRGGVDSMISLKPHILNLSVVFYGLFEIGDAVIRNIIETKGEGV